jgi:serine protease Do
LGLSVVPLTGDLADRHGLRGEKGVLVTGVDPASAAARAGIKAGMLIQEVNRRRVDTVEDFRKAASGKGTILLLVRDRSGSRYVALEKE